MRPRSPRPRPATVATLTVTVDEHLVPRNPRQPYRVWCSDETGRLCLTYFNGREDYLRSCCRPGERRVVSGKVELYQGEVQMTHPDHVVPLDERESILRVEPVYGLTAGLTPAAAAEGDRRRRRARAGAAGMAGRGLPQAAEAGPAGSRRSRQAHAPAEESRPLADASGARAARLRRAAGQPARDRAGAPSQPHRSPAARPRATAACSKRALAALPFQLTPSQIFATGEIAADMAKPERMIRLLQGDVGSGKTVVAFLAMLTARRGRRAGRADGADRDPGAPALRHHRAARRSGRRARWRC